VSTKLERRITTASPIAGLLGTDGYKQSHRPLYPQPGSEHGDGTGTTRILINWTNRSNKLLPNSSHAVVFGLQYFIQSYLVETWESFFAAAEDEVVDLFLAELDAYFGPGHTLDAEHVRALHRLGYLPLKVRALKEGTLAPIGVATVTIENTHDEFFWLPNYIETALSATIWHPSTTATVALEYRDIIETWVERTGTVTPGTLFQAHDFSMRGQTSLTSAAASGAGHLTSFLGTDSMPSLDFIRRYYPGENGALAGSVPATEHSVMCIRGQQGELEVFKHILDTFPTGVVSAVSDGYDLFKVLTEVLPQLKAEILSRDGKLVIRPDSGDPVDIVTGEYVIDEDLVEYEHAKSRGRVTPEMSGVVELLGDLFGYTVNDKGYKVLDSHIGVIYGDSITQERATAIFRRLAAKGWAAENVVLGVGSFTYQYKTRDNLGSAVKATWAVVDGEPVDIQKDPKTGGGGKKSAKGRIVLHRDETGEIRQLEGTKPEDDESSLLELVWEDGYFYRHQSFADVRGTLEAERAARKERRRAS
jgi:nicotinamide phosphoribosyltransferase